MPPNHLNGMSLKTKPKNILDKKKEITPDNARETESDGDADFNNGHWSVSEDAGNRVNLHKEDLHNDGDQ